MECKNSWLLQGKFRKDMAYLYYAQGNDCKTLEYISQAKEIISIAVHSKETTFVLHTDLRLRRDILFKQPFCSKLIRQLRKNMNYSLNMQSTWKSMKNLPFLIFLQ